MGSQDFWEKVALLILTGALSGFLIPYVLKRVDESKLKEQKEFEANLIRQSNVLEAQIKLLEKLSESLWKLQLLSLAVAYYKVHPNQERYEIALKDYDEKSWGLFQEARCEISKAARLVPEERYLNLLEFFSNNVIKEVDEKLILLIEINASPEEWKSHYDWLISKFPEEIDKVITPLAKELKLASPKAMSNNGHAHRLPRVNRL